MCAKQTQAKELRGIACSRFTGRVLDYACIVLAGKNPAVVLEAATRPELTFSCLTHHNTYAPRIGSELDKNRARKRLF